MFYLNKLKVKNIKGVKEELRRAIRQRSKKTILISNREIEIETYCCRIEDNTDCIIITTSWEIPSYRKLWIEELAAIPVKFIVL